MDYSYTRETLDNGVRLLWMDLPHVHSVALHAAVRAGSAYETKANNGVSHLLEHLHMAVTRRQESRGALDEAFADLPAERNASTSADKIEFECEGRPDNGAELAELLGDILEIRDYPAAVVASEKQLIESELATDDTPTHVLEELLADHPYALPLAGTRRSVRRLTREQLHTFDGASFAPSRIVVAIAGKLLPSTLECAREQFGRLARAGDGDLPEPIAPRVRLPKVRRSTPHRRERCVTLGFMISDLLHPPERLLLSALCMGLSMTSGPLAEKLRYGDASTYTWDTELYKVLGTRLLYLYGWTLRRKREAFTKTVLESIAALRNGSSPSDWLPRLQRYYRCFVEQALDRPGSLAARICTGECAAPPESVITVNEELDLIDAITMENLRTFAQRYLTLDRAFLFYDARTRLFDASRVEKITRDYLS